MQSVQCLPQLEHFVLLDSDDEACQLLDIDLLLQATVQEHLFDAHMVHRPPLVRREGDE
jgi:hypothetical protein